MNKDIKRLLMLSSIPGFKLNQKEILMLEEWKNAQEPIKPKKAKKTKRTKTTNRVKIEKNLIEETPEITES